MGTCFYSSSRHSKAKCQVQECLNIFPTFSLLLAGQNTLHTSPMPIHPQVSVTQNQLESQCKSAHWSSLSSGANTFFRHCDTSLARKSAPPLFIIILGTCFYSSSRNSFSLHFFSIVSRTKHTPHLPCLYILKLPSLRINWRASVNLLIDQVSALVPTLFFVIVTLHLRGSLHTPFHHNFGRLFLQLFKTFTSQVPSARMPKHFSLHFLYYQQDTTHSTPLPCLYILKFLSLRINWRASVKCLNIFLYIFSIISRIQHTRHLSHAYTSSSFCHSESIGEPV